MLLSVLLPSAPAVLRQDESAGPGTENACRASSCRGMRAWVQVKVSLLPPPCPQEQVPREEGAFLECSSRRDSHPRPTRLTPLPLECPLPVLHPVKTAPALMRAAHLTSQSAQHPECPGSVSPGPPAWWDTGSPQGEPHCLPLLAWKLEEGPASSLGFVVLVWRRSPSSSTRDP